MAIESMAARAMTHAANLRLDSSSKALEFLLVHLAGQVAIQCVEASIGLDGGTPLRLRD